VSSALVVAPVFSLGGWAQRYAMSVRDIDGMQVALGRWVHAHVPVGAPVAAHDIGAIGYISNHPVVDIEGLVTPRFLALKREQPEGRRVADIDAEIKRLGARYLIAFPRAYQSLTTQPGVRRVYSVTVRDPLIVQEATMSVYEVVSRESGVGSRESGVGSRKSEVGSRKSEVGSRKSEVGSRKSEVGSRKSEVGSRKSEVGSRKSEVGSKLQSR